MKKILVLLLACMLSVHSTAAWNGTVSVITCAPGDEAYSLFGHTGVRYRDANNGTDVVFSYGYFDFGAPNFIWRFILGETDYMVGVVPYKHFIKEYEERGSAVVEQVLNLSPEQGEAIVEALVENCRPENRVYRYNYFYNNCTTRVRDLVFDIIGDVNYTNNSSVAGMTFREALALLTEKHPWYAFGIDLLLGADVDKTASRMELQFIPSFVMVDLDSVRLTGCGDSEKALVEEKVHLLQEQSRADVKSNFTPFNASLLLLLLTMIVMLCELRRRRTYWWYDVMLMLMQGIPGVLLLFMSLFSSHPGVACNWLLLLLNPLSLVLIPVLVYRIVKRKSLMIAWVQVAFVCLFFLSAAFVLQNYPTPIYFCALALLVRSLFHIYKEKICDLNLL